MAIRSYYWSADNRLRRDLSDEDIAAFLANPAGLLWVDVGNTTAEDGEWLRRVFGFHPLAVEDCVSPLIHFPKVDDFGTYLFLIVHGVDYSASQDVLETTEMALFLGPNYVVSNHDYPMLAVETVAQRAEQGALSTPMTADVLAHALIDSVVDHVLPMVDRMAEVAEAVEQAAIQDPRRETLEIIRKLKRSTLRLLRIMEPQREVLSLLSRGAFPQIRPEFRIYYRDLYDHLVRITDLNHALRQVSDDALETYLTSVANRQNESIKVLTAIAIVFLPLTLITSFYGMNFDYLPGLQWRYGYLVVLTVMLVTAAATAVWLAVRYWPRKVKLGLGPHLRVEASSVSHLLENLATLARRLRP